ncbi:hypothetical protein D3C76_1245680 [compost metagenome]
MGGQSASYKVDKSVFGIILVNSKDLYPVILEQTGAYIANLKEDTIRFDGWVILQLLQLSRIQIFEASMIITAGSLHLCTLHRLVNTECQGKHGGDQKRSQYDGTDDSEIASTVGFEAFFG